MKLRLLLFILIPALLIGQQRDDFLRPFWGYYESQSLSTAIGNATVASGQVIPGHSSNPANLGLSRFSQVQVNFQHAGFQSPGMTTSTTQLSGIYAVMPVPVYRGSLVFGSGLQRITDFTNAFQTSTRRAEEEGGLNSLELGMSIEAAENLFVGAAFDYLTGQNEFSTTEADTNIELNPTYRGYNFSVGFLNRTNPHLQIGGSVQLLTPLKVQDKLTAWPDGAPDSAASETWNYRLTRPMVFHLGFSVLYPAVSAFYELEWSDWSDLDFSSEEYYEGDVAQINREFNNELRSTLTHHLGAAAHLPWLPLHLYAGYQYLPVPFTGEYTDNRRQSLSGGISYLLNQQFSVHSSYVDYFWKKNGREESCEILTLGVAFHY